MGIKRIINTLYGSNTYVVYKDNEALLIDPGSEFEKVDKFISDNKLKVLAVLLTHGHFDHCYCAYKFEEKGIPIFISSLERNKVLTDGDMAKFEVNTFTPCKSVLVFNKAMLKLGEFSIRVLQTPGHTYGSLSFLIEDNLFTGDLVFKNGIGRYDLFDSSEHSLVSSLKRICLLNNEVKVYPGHGMDTTIKDVKNYLNIK